MYELTAPHFHDAEAARTYLEALRWPNGPVCPHCGTEGHAWALEAGAQKKTSKARKGLYKCGSYGCLKQFTVTVGTVFEGSKVPLNKWLMATYLMNASKKGISSHQLHRMLGVTYKTAWFMTHRIREAMTTKNTRKLGAGGGVVEADETFWGNNKKRKGSKGRGYEHKMKILSLVERGGEVRSFKIPTVTAATLKPILKQQIAEDANLMTDEHSGYIKPGREFASHEVVRHSAHEYSRGDVTTNTVEGYFSLLKRGLVGTFHHVGEQHLMRYVHEFDFRYNHREVTDRERADAALRGIEGKRLTYRD